MKYILFYNAGKKYQIRKNPAQALTLYDVTTAPHYIGNTTAATAAEGIKNYFKKVKSYEKEF